MNLQAKRSVFRSRKSQHRTKGIQADLATSFLAHRLAVKNRKKEAQDARREARDLARPRRRGAQVTSSRRPSMNMATAILLGAFAALSRRKSSASTNPLEK